MGKQSPRLGRRYRPIFLFLNNPPTLNRKRNPKTPPAKSVSPTPTPFNFALTHSERYIPNKPMRERPAPFCVSVCFVRCLASTTRALFEPVRSTKHNTVRGDARPTKQDAGQVSPLLSKRTVSAEQMKGGKRTYTRTPAPFCVSARFVWYLASTTRALSEQSEFALLLDKYHTKRAIRKYRVLGCGVYGSA